MRQLTINGEQFDVPTAEECGIIAGYVCDAAAAKQLYQVRNENIRNNQAKVVKDAIENGGVTGETRSRVTEYATAYTFAMPSEGGVRVTDPVEKEQFRLARDTISEHLANTGRKVKDFTSTPEGKAAYEAEVERIANDPDIIKLARDRVKKKAAATEAALARGVQLPGAA